MIGVTGMIDIRDYGLKPCPFYGSTNLNVISEPRDFQPSSAYFLLGRMVFFDIELQCRCGLSFERTCVSLDKFIKAWNTRGGEQDG